MKIRPVKPGDAEALRRINQSATQGMLLNYSTEDFNDTEALIANLTSLDHLLVLETDEDTDSEYNVLAPKGMVVGAILIVVDPQIYLRHTASVRLISDPEWRGKGLGRMLMAAALSLADEELMTERVEMEIPTDNVGALKLCKTSGFHVEGIAKDLLTTPDGKYLDAYLMAHCPTDAKPSKQK